MKNLNLLLTALVTSTVLTSCSMTGTKSNAEIQSWNVNINAEKMEMPVLNADGTPNNENRKPYLVLWNPTDSMEVFSKGESLDTVCPNALHSSKAVVNAQVHGNFAVGDTVELFLPPGDIDYTGQDGTEATALSNYFYADGMFVIKNVDEQTSVLTTNDSVMNPKQAFVEFRFQDELAKPVMVSQLTIRSASGQLAVHGGSNQSTLKFDDLIVQIPSPSSTVFVAMRNKLHDRSFTQLYNPEADVADTYTLTALSTDGISYTATWKARLLYGNVYLTAITLKKM